MVNKNIKPAELFNKYLIEEKKLVETMTEPEFEEHCEMLEHIVFEAKARMQACREEREEREKRDTDAWLKNLNN